MRRSAWIAGLKGSFVSFLGMSEFEAEKAAVIAADHARGPWDAERVVVPPCSSYQNPDEWVVEGYGTDMTMEQAGRAMEILNGFEAARDAYMRAGRCDENLSTLRAFFQIEEE